MTIWDLELTMTPLVGGAQRWPIVLMEQGKIIQLDLYMLVFQLLNYHISISPHLHVISSL